MKKRTTEGLTCRGRYGKSCIISLILGLGIFVGYKITNVDDRTNVRSIENLPLTSLDLNIAFPARNVTVYALQEQNTGYWLAFESTDTEYEAFLDLAGTTSVPVSVLYQGKFAGDISECIQFAPPEKLANGWSEGTVKSSGRYGPYSFYSFFDGENDRIVAIFFR